MRAVLRVILFGVVAGGFSASMAGADVAGNAQGGVAGAPPSSAKDGSSGAESKAPSSEEKSQQPDSDQNAPTAPKSRLGPNSQLFASAGYSDRGLSGSRSKFRQYATVPQGFYLRDLRFAPVLRSPSESAFYNLKGIGQDDYRGEARLLWNYGATRTAASFSRFRFAEPLPNAVDPNSRHIENFRADQALNRDFGLTFRFRNDFERENFEHPFLNLDQTTQFVNAEALGKLGPGFANFNYSSLHFADHTGTLLNSTTETSGLSYLLRPSDILDLEAAYSHVAIQQPGLAQSHLDIMSVGGDLSLGQSTELGLRFQQRNVGLPSTQTAYVRAQSLGMASVFHRWHSWRAQVGFRLQEDERVNGGHTFVDVPKWSTVEGRLSGRVLDGWRVTVRGYTQTLNDPPSAITLDPASLYWNGRNYLQVRLEGGPPEIDYYLVYTYRADRNSARSTEVRTTQYTLGSVWQLSPTVSLFGEYHHETWSGHTDFDAFPALANFLPNSTTGIVELTWNQRRLFMSVSFTGFSEDNDNPLLLQDGNATGNFVTLNATYRFQRGYELGLTVAPWSYRDSVARDLNYDAAVVMVTGSARF